MKISANLKLMRKEWYSAFYALNIEQLDYLEADWFISTNGVKLMYKNGQLKKLSGLRRENQLAFARYKRTESNLHIRELGNLASVSGVALISAPEGDKCIHFMESWIKLQGSWKLQLQAFEDVNDSIIATSGLICDLES